MRCKVRFENLCPKTYRLLINFYYRELMKAERLEQRETYVLLLRHLERQLRFAEDREAIAY